MVRWMFLLHRYLGIVLGLIMALWCLSGIVMMYVQYPKLTEQEQIAGLAPLDLENCCSLPTDPLLSTDSITRFRVEMLAGTPVLRLTTVFGPDNDAIFDLQEGKRLESLTQDQIRKSALVYQQQSEIGGSAHYEGEVQKDQWTIYASYNRHRPLYKFSATDSLRTEWYVSSTTGEVIQATTGHQRFWNWLGAVVHWLYPTQLRQHTVVWYWLVVGLSIIGIFLTVIGLYIGVRQYKSRRSGRYSPYRGVSLWHHYSGLLFGVLVLTWVVSGFFSMNPWGFLEGGGMAAEQTRLQGRTIEAQELASFVEQINLNFQTDGLVRLEGYVLADQFTILATDRSGQRTRYNEQLQANALKESFWEALPKILFFDSPVISAGWQTGEDAYYYDHHVKLHYPVYRIAINNPGENIYYFDSVSGEILRKVDTEQRWYRWLHYGLHRGDFTGLLRSRPIWDIFMLFLMAGVTISCLTGTYMGFRRLRRDSRRKKMRIA